MLASVVFRTWTGSSSRRCGPRPQAEGRRGNFACFNKLESRSLGDCTSPALVLVIRAQHGAFSHLPLYQE
jgi:hypothetical protein